MFKGTKKKKKQQPAAVGGYEQKKQDAAERSLSQSKRGRDIAAEFPPAGNRERREACRLNFRLFCETYLPKWFHKEWSEDHLEAIKEIEQAVLHGDAKALAMPRGSGKTTLCIAAVLWALLYVHIRFVCLIAATKEDAVSLLEKVKNALQFNDLLIEDFRAVTYPIARLENDGRRARGQLFNGTQTRIGWGADEMTLPTIPGDVLEEWERPAAAGSTITVRGLTGALRGQSNALATGEIIRPQLVLLDDPQTRESAYSQSQSDRRVAIVNGDVLGMAGPGEKIAALMPCTVIAPGDMADQMLDRKKHPVWRGQRTKMMYEFPERMDLWEEYAGIRTNSLIGGGDGKPATEFYIEHKSDMDAGARVAWLARYNTDEVSAIQHAMNLMFRDKASFMAEYQNQPLPPAGDELLLKPDQVMAKASGLARGTVPLKATHLVAHLDVQGDSLWWGVYAGTSDFTMHLVDDGLWPKQPGDVRRIADVRVGLRAFYKKQGKNLQVMAAIFQGLTDLADYLDARDWPIENDAGTPLKIQLAAVDSKWGDSNETVRAWVRQRRSPIWISCIGHGIGPDAAPMGDWKERDREQRGDHWILHNDPKGRELGFDTNHWKSFADSGLRSSKGDKGTITIYGKPEQHRGLALGLTSEFFTPVEGRGRRINVWKPKPGKPDNHPFDNLVACCALLSVRGCSPTGVTVPKSKRKKRKFNVSF